MKLMKEIDPLAVNFRGRRRIKRKIYRTNGPNHIWHVDGLVNLTKTSQALMHNILVVLYSKFFLKDLINPIIFLETHRGVIASEMAFY